MMRLPKFRYVAPKDAREAARVLAAEGPGAMVLGGGTDLLPNMKRRHQQPKVLVALGRIAALQGVRSDGAWTEIGAGTTLGAIARDRALRDRLPALFQAAAQVATPLIRNQATLGGNLCLDTRCTYYNQNEEWRAAIDNCMKAPIKTGGVYTAGEFVGGGSGDTDHDGEERGSVCWVAPGGPRCWAVSSTDSAPALIAMGAEVELTSAAGERRIPLSALYNNDGMAYLTKRPDEILTRVFVPNGSETRSTYWKLRRRGSFDFPVVGVGASVRRNAQGAVEDATLVLGAVASRPLICADAVAKLRGSTLDDAAIATAADEAARLAKPMDNTDFTLGWRKSAVKAMVRGALAELRGDDPNTLGVFARHARRSLPLAMLG